MIQSNFSTQKRERLTPDKLLIPDVLPHSEELERTLIGTLLVDKKAFPVINEFLQADHFYLPAHIIIYQHLVTLNRVGAPIHSVSLSHELKKNDQIEYIGGNAYLSHLVNEVAITDKYEYFAKAIQELSIKRELIIQFQKDIRELYDSSTDIFKFTSKHEKSFLQLTSGMISGEPFKTAEEVVHQEVIPDLQRRAQLGDSLSGAKTGFVPLDRLTQGWQDTDFILIAARPSMGKTAFFLSAVDEEIQSGIPVGIVSLEMSNRSLIYRLFSINAHIDSSTFRRGQLTDTEWKKITGSPVVSKILFMDDKSQYLHHVISSIRRMVRRGAKVIYIDYLQLIRIEGFVGNFEQEVSEISRAIKMLAKELVVPIIALSQLSRAVETRGGDKRPQLSDLRNSGSLEQDADLIMFLYRPEYYKISIDEEGFSTKGMAEVIVKKHRNGGLADIKLKFIDRFTKFLDLAESEYTKWPEDQS